MASPSKTLLIRASELAELDRAVAVEALHLANRIDARSATYALVGMVCGTLCFLGCVVAFLYLVIHGHPQTALVVLGTGVLAIIRTIIHSRI